MSGRGSRSRGARGRGLQAAMIAVVLLALAAILLLVGRGGSPRVPSAGVPAQTTPAAEQYGVNVNRLFNDQTYSPAEIDTQLSALRRTGASLARSDTLWEATEPEPPVGGVHRYQWGFDDAVAGDLAAHGLRWLAIVDYSAAWAQSTPGHEHAPPEPAGAYAAFAGAFAARYGRGGAFWAEHPGLPAAPVETYEIWNEPDNPSFWVPAPNAGRYAELYLAARDAIKAVDPAATVVVGGLTRPDAFLPAMLSARPGLRGHIDGVATHPYGVSPQGVLSHVRSSRATLDSLGLGAVPLYLTEFGWTTSPSSSLSFAPAGLRPGYLITTLAGLGHLDCGIAASVLYTWVTPERNPANQEDWYGIHPPGGGASPATAAFAAGLQEAKAPSPRLSCAGAR